MVNCISVQPALNVINTVITRETKLPQFQRNRGFVGKQNTDVINVYVNVKTNYCQLL